ncbi:MULTISPECIES: helix-turn-helix domain-containing protein [Vibrio]|uniref:helix-turn-helix domain-containing protein n=2 Tax=Vibrio TaxID=662 RepID=UPI001EFC860A|nr:MULTISPECIES: helix-turn-helix domain-containing protein [Vibrio]MCF4176160.1 helix-turn-helix domain-containing protein [Vibrio sp. McD22-P3]MCG9624748.1 helix-turn-helix domain-containing protein [Vibrio mediterranei]MCG9788261.1 helix-turn-helix domain-containing protein [Vibrio mediterranei]MCY9852233.1 helix-turn-helix domain-containing protein [Vibrio mediterranei]MCY9872652.1 helix-turn-helix domain-containing protein [Vibrio barjaei]
MKCEHVCDLSSCTGCEQLNKLQMYLGLKLKIDEEKVVEMNSLTNMSMLTVRTLCVFSRYGENHIVSKYNIKDYVWQRPVTDNNLTHTIHKCRNVLRESKTEFDVVNIRGFGYCLMNINFVGGNIG